MEFKQAVITNYGRELMAKLLNGKQTKFTKLRISSTVYNDAQLSSLTALTNIKREAAVNVYEKNQATVLAIGKINNDGVTVGFDINTVGLYAEDPDRGEILYSVSAASVKGYVPASNGGKSSTAIELRIYTEVSNAANVTMNVEPNDPVTNYDLERFKENYFDKVETNELLARIFAGEEIELTFTDDLNGKILDSTTANPHEMHFSTRAVGDLGKPSYYGGKSQQALNGLYKLDGQFAMYNNTDRLATVEKDKMVTLCHKWNLLESLNIHLPGIYDSIGAKNVSDKVAILKELIVGTIAQRWHGYGTGPSGNYVSFTSYIPDKDLWQTTYGKTNSTNAVQELYKADTTGIISDDGWVYSAATTEASDGVTRSIVYADYASITYTVKFKLSDFLKPKTAWANTPNGMIGVIGEAKNLAGINGRKISNQTKTLIELGGNLSELGLEVGDKVKFTSLTNISGSGFAGEFAYRLGSNSYQMLASTQSNLTITKAETVKSELEFTINASHLADKNVFIRLDNVPSTVAVTPLLVKLEVISEKTDKSFTTIYPGENVFPNSQLLAMPPILTISQLTNPTIVDAAGGKALHFSSGERMGGIYMRKRELLTPIIAGTKWTIRFTAKGFGKFHRLLMENSTNISLEGPFGAVDIPGAWTEYVITGVSADAAGAFCWYIEAGSELYIRDDIKIELAENPDIVYTTAPSEDFLASFPHYIGTSAVVSDNPADYDWRRTEEYVDYLFSEKAASDELIDLANRVSLLEKGGNS